MTQLPPIQHVHRDLVAHLYGLGRMLDYSIRPGAGAAMLGLKSVAAGDLPPYDDFDISEFSVACGLAAIYRYASRGEIENPLVYDLDPDSGPLGRMNLLAGLLAYNSEAYYCLDEVAGDLDDERHPRAGFADMVERAVARAKLDEDYDDLTPRQVALLAGLSEKSVANARAGGADAALPTTRSESGHTVVSAKDARAWLSGRPGFRPSIKVGLFAEVEGMRTRPEITVIATLTDAGIRNGYVDLESRFAQQLFPSDSFGGRGSTEVGRAVTLHVDGTSYETDFRIKSKAWVSPRRRLSAYFKAHRAEPGDRVRFTKRSEREFVLTFVAGKEGV